MYDNNREAFCGRYQVSFFKKAALHMLAQNVAIGVFLSIILCLSYTRASIIHAGVPVHAIPLPVDFWVPPKTLSLSGELVPCKTDLSVAPTDRNATTTRIPFCTVSSVGDFRYYEEALEGISPLAPAVVVSMKARPGVGFRLTNGRSRYAPQIPTLQISGMFMFNATDNNTVDLSFKEGNYSEKFSTSPTWIILLVLYNFSNFFATGYGVYKLILHLLYFYSKNADRLKGFALFKSMVTFEVVCLFCCSISFIPFLISGLDMYGTQHLFNACALNFMFTLGLPIVLLAVYIKTLKLQEIYFRVKNIDDKMTTITKRAFGIFFCFVFTIELSTSVGSCTIADQLSWWSFPKLFFLIVTNVFCMVYSIVWTVRFSRLISNLVVGEKKKKSLVPQRTYLIYVQIIPCFTWLLLLVAQWFIPGIEDDDTYISVALISGLVGVGQLNWVRIGIAIFSNVPDGKVVFYSSHDSATTGRTGKRTATEPITDTSDRTVLNGTSSTLSLTSPGSVPHSAIHTNSDSYETNLTEVHVTSTSSSS